MSQMLDEVGPIHWAIDVQQLPKANSGVEFEPYVKQAQIFYSTLPEPTDNDQRVHFAWEGEVGTMELEALPFPSGTKANHIGPVVTWMDDSIQRLQYALKDGRKRRQALGRGHLSFLPSTVRSVAQMPKTWSRRSLVRRLTTEILIPM